MSNPADEPAPARHHEAARGRIEGIDALRALAVLSVVVYHLDSAWLPGGFAGVDIFFVISGYVVTRTFDAHGHEKLFSFIAGFYARRARRILPALLVCLVVTVTVDALVVPQAWLSSHNFATARYALLGLSNVYLARHQESYFSPRIEFNPYAHTWSLGVEEQFYVVLPFLYFMTLSAGASRRSGAWRAIPAVCIASMAVSGWLSFTGSASAYYALTSRFWELGVGALLAEYHRRHLSGFLPVAFSRSAATSLSALLLGAGLIVSGWWVFPFPTALLVVAGSVVLIDQLAFGRARSPDNPAWAPFVYVGSISYSIYLWHWPVFSLFRWTVGLDGLRERGVALVVVAVLSVASYHLVERAFQRSPRRPLGRQFGSVGVIGVGIASIAGAMLLVTFVRDRQPDLSLSVTRDTRTWYPDNYSALPSAVGCRSAQRAEPFDLGYRLMIDRIDCEPAGARHTVFVAGDSHVDAYMTMLGQLVAQRPYRVEAYILPGCPFFMLRTTTREMPAGCDAFVAATIAELGKRARRGDVLFLPSLRMKRIVDQWGDIPDEADPGPEALSRTRDRAVADAAIALEALYRLGIIIVFEAPKPIFGAPAFRCADPFDRMNPVCARGFQQDAAALLSQRAPVLAGMRALQERLPNVRVWDPFPILCPSATCNAFDGRVPLFFDGDHLSAAGNRKLFPYFMSFLESIAPPGDSARH